ncbi:MAG: ribose-phosphate diphosphokinase [Desulfurococcaceae archaeon]
MIIALIQRSYFEEGLKIANSLRSEVLEFVEKMFPDGEQYVRIIDPNKLENNVVLIISTLYPGQDVSLFKTLLLADASRRHRAREIIGVIPYIAYSRQDKAFLPGEPVSAELVIDMFKAAGFTGLLTVDIHNPDVLKSFGDKAVNIFISDLLVERALKYVSDPVVISPDKGALNRARYAAEIHGLEYDYMVKSRDRITGVISYATKSVDINGRDAVLIDDIISTGGTIAEASKILYEKGARRVVVAASHGLMVGDALSKLEKANIHKVILANTLGIRHRHELIEYVDISGRVADEVSTFLAKLK